jgi:hypothetical protein
MNGYGVNGYIINGYGLNQYQYDVDTGLVYDTDIVYGKGPNRKIKSKGQNQNKNRPEGFNDRFVAPIGENQKLYCDYLANMDIGVVTGLGPAGCGKTLFACQAGVRALMKKDIDRIIMTRPLVSADEECGVSVDEQSMGPVTSEDATNMVSADSRGGEIIIEVLLRNLVKHVPIFGQNMLLGRGSDRENLPLLLLLEKLRCHDSFAADNRDNMSLSLNYFSAWTRASASGEGPTVGPLLEYVIFQVKWQLGEVMALLAIANDVDGESFNVDEEPFVVSLFKEMVARASAERKIDGCRYSDKSLVVFLLLGWVMLSSIRCSVDVREESFLESLLQLAFRCYLDGIAPRFDTLTETFTSFLLEDVSFLEPSLISELSEAAKNVEERQGALLVILLLEIFAIEASANGWEDKVAGIFRTFCGD